MQPAADLFIDDVRRHVQVLQGELHVRLLLPPEAVIVEPAAASHRQVQSLARHVLCTNHEPCEPQNMCIRLPEHRKPTSELSVDMVAAVV